MTSRQLPESLRIRTRSSSSPWAKSCVLPSEEVPASMVRVCGVGAKGLEQAVQAPCPPGLPPTEQASATPAQAAESPASTRLTPLPPPPCHVQRHHRPRGKPLHGAWLSGLAGSGGHLPPGTQTPPQGLETWPPPLCPQGLWTGRPALLWTLGAVRATGGLLESGQQLGGAHPPSVGSGGLGRRQWEEQGWWAGGTLGCRHHPPSWGPRVQKRLRQTHGRTVVIFDGALLTRRF